ncbi:hypothetical protein IAQ61_009632, partial [Plenodomus lingam]|uniref:Predicted protein n=1 Tax=Leptosphaeria maculans (strain JN3 / isolate v23.1.3 / race Av1-4-5-6-7-8) TaxID=985895 RepID=E4ZSU0_LEPMJ
MAQRTHGQAMMAPPRNCGSATITHILIGCSGSRVRELSSTDEHMLDAWLLELRLKHNFLSIVTYTLPPTRGFVQTRALMTRGFANLCVFGGYLYIILGVRLVEAVIYFSANAHIRAC